MSRKKIIIPIIVFTVIIIFLVIILNISTKYNKLLISESKWNSIIDSRTENKDLVLDNIEFNDYSLIIDKNNDILYYSIVNDSKNKYNPSVSYHINNKNAKLAILTEKITDEKVKSNYKFKIIIYDDKNYNIYDLVCTDLPILNIIYKENLEDTQRNIPMEIFLFNNFKNTPNKITISSGKLKIDEDSYIFVLNMMTPGKNIRDNKISILNMKPNSKYILTKIDGEEKEIEEKSGESKDNKVELFINNESKGVYSLEHAAKAIKENKE